MPELVAVLTARQRAVTGEIAPALAHVPTIRRLPGDPAAARSRSNAGA